MRIYRLDKTVLSVRNNPAQFLNGLTSNSLDQPQNAFLTIHGRIVATFDQVKAGEDCILLCVEKAFVDATLRHTERYLKLSRTTMAREDYGVYFDLDGKYSPDWNEFVIAQKKGQLILSRKVMNSNISDEEFTLFRLDNGIPRQGVDYTDDFALNVSETDFVSYTKGCFLGQEPVSKVHNRSKPTWKLVARYADECSGEERAKMTSCVKEPSSGREKGFVFVGNP